ncbi:hypothetical protein DRN74_06745 [Candidatus Micrarchaeota archaeon]|nr:MAG: hypothetical protein DRN74_06745 [Candidatus Micrarchaeota archaeon]
MGLDIWLRDDIERALEAAELASSATVAVLETADPAALRMFRRGYRAALTVVALNFGLGGDDGGDHGLQRERLHRGSDPVPHGLLG